MTTEHEELLNEEKSFIKKIGFGNLITIIVFIGGAIATNAVALNQIKEVRANVDKLTNERDGIIIVQTQQKEINQRLDKLDEKQDKIFELVLSIKSAH